MASFQWACRESPTASVEPTWSDTTGKDGSERSPSIARAMCSTPIGSGRDVGTILMEEGLAVPFVCGATRCLKTPSVKAEARFEKHCFSLRHRNPFGFSMRVKGRPPSMTRARVAKESYNSHLLLRDRERAFNLQCVSSSPTLRTARSDMRAWLRKFADEDRADRSALRTRAA
jgi:hypothetical protein